MYGRFPTCRFHHKPPAPNGGPLDLAPGFDLTQGSLDVLPDYRGGCPWEVESKPGD